MRGLRFFGRGMRGLKMTMRTWLRLAQVVVEVGLADRLRRRSLQRKARGDESGRLEGDVFVVDFGAAAYGVVGMGALIEIIGA